MTLILFITFFVLILLKIPIAFSLFIASLAAMIYGGFPLTAVIQRAISAADSFVLLAIPFFILAGNLMSGGGISKMIIRFANSTVGFIRGGLAHANITTSMLFSGISGAAVADTSAVGSVIIPAMKEEKYPSGFAAAVTASSSVIGVIIPPSIPFVIYGVVTGASVGQLFLAGIIPGILIGLFQMGIAYYFSKKYGYGNMQKFSVANFFMNFKQSVFALLMPIIIIGGILLGIVTPTEAAVIAIAYALIIGFFVYKQLNIRMLPGIFYESAVTTAIVMFMITGAYLYGWIITNQRIPQMLADSLSTVTTSPAIILLLCVLIYIIAGMFIDLGAAIILFVPVLFPVSTAFGIDPVHFGIVTVIALAVGLITPPVGACLFLSTEIAEASLWEGAKATLPFIIGILFVLMLVIFIPELSLYIPREIMP
ncbi:TRAP transporter large permease [Shouchella shacheensis]|uniref:TRAP transporter large permease n=1 Tax=Shouchella shacheensis TaxID=1649580 RepID=UPI0007401DB2|nr:TRAP transporter large permease [Shouchella shacheensis]